MSEEDEAAAAEDEDEAVADLADVVAGGEAGNPMCEGEFDVVKRSLSSI